MLRLGESVKQEMFASKAFPLNSSIFFICHSYFQEILAEGCEVHPCWSGAYIELQGIPSGVFSRMPFDKIWMLAVTCSMLGNF